MKKDFYIFRHGETNLNKERRWQGQGFDVEINDNGKKQAEELVEKLKNHKIEVIYSSPLKRAAMTAEIVAKGLHVPLLFADDLKEGNFGIMEGLTREEAENLNMEQVNRWMCPPEDFDCRFEGGESKREIAQRIKSVLEKIATSHHKTIGISTHGGAIRQFLTFIGFEPHSIPNIAVFHVLYEDGDWFLL